MRTNRKSKRYLRSGNLRPYVRQRQSHSSGPYRNRASHGFDHASMIDQVTNTTTYS